jgi:hypothetical protein
MWTTLNARSISGPSSPIINSPPSGPDPGYRGENPEEAGRELNYLWLRPILWTSGLRYKKTASPRNAIPITIPSRVACAKIRIAIPINAATIQSALMEPSLIG